MLDDAGAPLPHVGVLGLGAMGAPITRHLLDAGVPVGVVDLDPTVLADAEAAGAHRAASPAELSRSCPVVLVMLPSDDDVLQACTGLDGVLAGAGRGSTVLICSSVRPATCRQIADAAPAGVAVLDAALTGGLRAAEAGEINLLVGGDAAALDALRPVLAPWTSGVHLLGPLGAGQVAKTANNLIHWAQIVAITESFELARRHGVGAEALRAALAQGPTDSRTMRELQDFRLTWYVKDIENALAMAQDVDWPLPGARHSLQAMRAITVDRLARLLDGEDPGLTPPEHA